MKKDDLRLQIRDFRFEKQKGFQRRNRRVREECAESAKGEIGNRQNGWRQIKRFAFGKGINAVLCDLSAFLAAFAVKLCNGGKLEYF